MQRNGDEAPGSSGSYGRGEAVRGDPRGRFSGVVLDVAEVGASSRIGACPSRAELRVSVLEDLLVPWRKHPALKLYLLGGAAVTALPGVKSLVSNNSWACAEASSSLSPLRSHLFPRNLRNSWR